MLLLPPSNARSSILTIGRVSSSNGALHCRNQSRISLLELPAEILTIIVLELISYPNQRHRAPKTNQLGKLLLTESRKFNLIEFKGLLSFGLTCKYIHSICKRIYQKQVVLTLPSTKHTLMSQPRPRSRRDKWGHPYKRTIETHDSVARGWSGARNVNWLFISNQASYQPRRSAMFPRLISSTARLAQSFSNLKFLCLSRLNNETILSCLERGVGKNLEALSITLSEVEDSESVLRCLSNRIARLTTISQLQALQVNDIEPVWVGLINRVDNLKEVSLQITNFNSKIVQCLSAQTSLRKLEIFGGVREALPMGPGFFELLHRKFPEIEVFKCGLHFAGKENYYSGEVVSCYAGFRKVLSKWHWLKCFLRPCESNRTNMLKHSRDSIAFDGLSSTILTHPKYF